MSRSLLAFQFTFAGSLDPRGLLLPKCGPLDKGHFSKGRCLLASPPPFLVNGQSELFL